MVRDRFNRWNGYQILIKLSFDFAVIKQDWVNATKQLDGTNFKNSVNCGPFEMSTKFLLIRCGGI